MQLGQTIAAWVAAASLVALVVLQLVPPPETAKATPPTFEYLAVGIEDAALSIDLGTLGDRGWQIATCRRATAGEGADSREMYKCIMQRERADRSFDAAFEVTPHRSSSARQSFRIPAGLPAPCEKLLANHARCIEGMPEAARKPAMEGLDLMAYAWSRAPKDGIENACLEAYATAKGLIGQACPDVAW